MTFTDYLLDSVLVLVVLLQVRTSRFTPRSVLIPLAVVAFFAHKYLSSLPTGGNDVLLVVILCATGLVLGTASALTTTVWADGNRRALVKAGWIAVGAWVLGMGARMAFSIWADSDVGARGLVDFSKAHGITGAEVWTDALVLMAVFEVCSRTAVLYARSRRAVAHYRPQVGATAARQAV